MKKTGLLIIVCFMVIMMAAGHTAAAVRHNAFGEAGQRVRELFADISTINLINGLNLTRDQMTSLVEVAKKAEQYTKEATLGSSDVMNALNEAEKSFKMLKAEIQKGAPARGEIPKQAVMANNKIKELQNQISRDLSKKYAGLEDQVRRILSPEQVQVVETFKPCLIPPKDLKNPVRAGQASSNEGSIRIMRRIREIPEETWKQRNEELIGRHLERINKHRFKMTEEEMAREKERLLTLLEKIRSMSDMDFEMEKENLASELKPEDKLDSLREQMEKRKPMQKRPKVSKLGRYFLDKRIIPILEERLR